MHSTLPQYRKRAMYFLCRLIPITSILRCSSMSLVALIVNHMGQTRVFVKKFEQIAIYGNMIDINGTYILDVYKKPTRRIRIYRLKQPFVLSALPTLNRARE